MYTLTRRNCFFLAASTVCALTTALQAEEADDYTNFDLAAAGIKPVKPAKDAATGFVVGGTNATELIRHLKQLAGRSIAQLEADMRPGAKTEVASDAGFLGKDEKLLDVLAADNALVVDKLKLTHQEIARHLHTLGAIGSERTSDGKSPEFRYHGRRYRVEVQHTRGYQLSPFYDGTKSGSNATVINLDNGEKLEFALLVPYMIERYGFYEGQGTPYRVDPAQIVRVLDFLAGPK